MARWHIQETRELVAKRFGHDQLNLVRPSLQSVVDRQAYAHYHHHETQALLGSFVRTHLGEASMLDVVFGQDEDVKDEFNVFIIRSGAHLTAFVQSLHALGDTLAHAVYFSLGMNVSAKPLADRAISLPSVIQRCSGDENLHHVRSLLEEFHRGGSHAHLSALANHSKHRSIVRPRLTEHFAEVVPQRHELKLAAFSHEGVNYPEVTAGSFLEPEYNRCSKLVVDTGNALNEALRKNAP